MAIELKTMSRRELEALRGRIDKQLERLKNSDMKKAMEAAEAAAKQHGFSLKQLAAAAPAKAAKASKAKKSPKVVSAPRYCNPEDPSTTWTGRGRRPEWIKAGLAAGKSLEDFAIK